VKNSLIPISRLKKISELVWVMLGS
jgi:hypothetical protein